MPVTDKMPKTSREVREHSDSLAKLFDCLPNTFLFVKDRRHRFVRCNQALVELHGAEREIDLLGLTDADLHPPALATAYVDEDQSVMDDIEPIYGAVWLVTTVTSSRWYACTKLPVVRNGAKDNSHGEVIGVAGILTPYEGSGNEPPEYARIRAAITLADRSFASGLTVSDMAAEVQLSVNQFTRIFKKLFRVTPGEYLLRLKLDCAMRLLRHGTETISSVALNAGFYDHSAFTKHFRRRFGISPSHYRRQFGNG